MAGEIFISYRRVDRKWAQLLHERLRAEGLDSWYDALVHAGADWRSETTLALQGATTFVLLYSQAASESTDIAKELAVATLERKTVIPVRLENIPPSGPFLYELARLNWIDAFEATEERLVELAKSLADGQSIGVPLEQVSSRAPESKRIWRSYAAAGALVFVFLVAVGWLVYHRAVAPTGKQLTAVLDFTAPSGDTALAELSHAISNDMITAMGAAQLPLLARDEADGTTAKSRNSRAKAMGARFVIDGDIRREGNRLAVTARLDDLLTGTTVWSARFDGPSATARVLETQVAAQVVDTLRCATRGELGQADSDALGLMFIFCSRRDESRGGLSIVLQLAERFPNSAQYQAMLARGLIKEAHDAPPQARAKMLLDADAAARRALTLDPKLGAAYMALYALASERKAPIREREAILLKGLSLVPDHGALNNTYGELLFQVGRNREALSYIRLGLKGDPLSQAKPLTLAHALVANSLIDEARGVLDDLATRWPSEKLWRFRAKLAIYAGDRAGLDRLLADQPDDAAGAAQTACLRGFMTAMTLAHAGHVAGESAATIQRCLDEGTISADEAIDEYAAVSAIDDAYALARQERSAQIPVATAVFLTTATRTLRRDPRFLSLMRDLGLVEYWRSSGRWPDFCREPGLSINCSREFAKSP